MKVSTARKQTAALQLTEQHLAFSFFFQTNVKKHENICMSQGENVNFSRTQNKNLAAKDENLPSLGVKS